jgi:hypothetical protein
MREAIQIAGYVLESVRLVYWLIAAAVISLAVWLPKVRWQKAAWTITAVALSGFLPAKATVETYQQVQYRKEAWAHFAKRCKENAGEKIYKTAENVDGIFIMKPRPKATYEQLRDQYWMGDPYGYEGHELMVESYLWDLNDRGASSIVETPRKGFAFVESPSGKHGDSSLIRYTLDRKKQKLIEEVISNRASVYGVTWVDISTREDRKYWVAGSRFQIVDLLSNEVIAERIGYLIESGFGSSGKGMARLPWEAARITGSACPPIPRNVSIDRVFVEKALQPSPEKAHAK